MVWTQGELSQTSTCGKDGNILHAFHLWIYFKRMYLNCVMPLKCTFCTSAPFLLVKNGCWCLCAVCRCWYTSSHMPTTRQTQSRLGKLQGGQQARVCVCVCVQWLMDDWNSADNIKCRTTKRNFSWTGLCLHVCIKMLRGGVCSGFYVVKKAKNTKKINAVILPHCLHIFV